MDQPAQNSAVDAPEFRRRDWPFYWITQASARYHQVMEPRLKAKGLDIPRWRVLMSLYEDDWLSVSSIADACIIKLNTATKIIQRMVADGLVITRPSQTDKRATEVSLTAEGIRQRGIALAIAEEVRATALADLTPEDHKALNTLLERIFDRMGQL